MTTLVDDFNRANSASSLGTPSDGLAAWDSNVTWGIVSNAAYNPGGESTPPAFSLAWRDAGASDVEVETQMATTQSFQGLVFRYVDSNNYLLAVTWPDQPRLRIFKRVSGTLTEMTGYTVPSGNGLADGDVFLVRCEGSSIEVEKNGTVVMTLTETDLQTATKHGMLLAQTSVASFNYLNITDLGGGGGGGGSKLPVIFQQLMGA